MLDFIRQSPHQLSEGWNLASQIDLKNLQGKKFDSVIIAGMGGSTLVVDMINNVYDTHHKIRAWRDYGLPPISPHTLVICSSYSGNTEETLEALDSAVKQKCPLVVVSHQGDMQRLALEQNLVYAKVPFAIQPRCAVGYFFSIFTCLLNRLGLLKAEAGEFYNLEKKLLESLKDDEEEAKNIAVFLKDRVPLVYGPTFLDGVLRAWKIKFNENSKVPGFFNVLPELNHNEMMGFTHNLFNPAVVLVDSVRAHPGVKKRIRILQTVLGDKVPMRVLQSFGDSLLVELFRVHAIADFSSCYLAYEYGIDPAPVELVEIFKKLLNE